MSAWRHHRQRQAGKYAKKSYKLQASEAPSGGGLGVTGELIYETCRWIDRRNARKALKNTPERADGVIAVGSREFPPPR